MVLVGMVALVRRRAGAHLQRGLALLLQGGDRLAGRGRGVLLVGAAFLCGAYVQSLRGHVGIEALAELLPPRGQPRARCSWSTCSRFLFCAFFAWKSWTLLHEAWVDRHDDLVDLGAAAVDPLRADGGRA